MTQFTVWSGSHLLPQQLRRQRSGGSWFKASLGKKLVRPYLNKQVRYGGVYL
jgi:hypothetical protein